MQRPQKLVRWKSKKIHIIFACKHAVDKRKQYMWYNICISVICMKFTFCLEIYFGTSIETFCLHEKNTFSPPSSERRFSICYWLGGGSGVVGIIGLVFPTDGNNYPWQASIEFINHYQTSPLIYSAWNHSLGRHQSHLSDLFLKVGSFCKLELYL